MAIRGSKSVVKHRRIQPYAWLGAGTVALGMGAAMVGGTAVAVADTGAADSSATSASAAPSAKADSPVRRSAASRAARVGDVSRAAAAHRSAVTPRSRWPRSNCHLLPRRLPRRQSDPQRDEPRSGRSNQQSTPRT